MSAAETGHHHDHPAPAASGTKVKDVVCGMSVDPAKTPHRATHDSDYFFCSAKCRAKFVADPAKYLAPAPPPPLPSNASNPPPNPPPLAGEGKGGGMVSETGTIWTCPMHPEIRRDGPGACPICGMALEPLHPAASTAPNPELADMQRRFWIGLVLAAPVLALAMLGGTMPWLQFALATPVVLWAGWPFFVRG